MASNTRSRQPTTRSESTRFESTRSGNSQARDTPETDPQETKSTNTITIDADQWQAIVARVESLSTPHVPQKSNLKPCAPDLYYGRSHKELHEFMRQCTDNATVAQMEMNSPTFIAFAAGHLRGDIVGNKWVTYKALHSADHVYTWEEFRLVLRKALGTQSGFLDKTWAKFSTYRQKSYHSVQDVAIAIQQIGTILAEYDVGQGPSESMLIRRLRYALRDDVSSALMNQGERVKDFPFFVDKAMEAEAAAKMLRRSHTASQKDRSRSRSPDKIDSNRSKKPKKRKRYKAKQNDSGSTQTPASGTNKEEIKCYKCGGNHKADNPICPKYDAAIYEQRKQEASKN